MEFTAEAMPTVTISQAEYDQLNEDSGLLNMLRAHGVDNWQGYDDAIGEFYADE